ncbi:hypothetical protein [Acanthopleuribacter pedis]|uniref:Uncharacterized protein n=1 Tax=Acanthopleuribacter pedis TaxID=442870 RepID=A0A8J7QKX8_9BACT|nr:hypothetical protein [Acanthopleuribacter pedis]MBO1322976.1 hypothetical protein [Acanthopleuribacter pedis]
MNVKPDLPIDSGTGLPSEAVRASAAPEQARRFEEAMLRQSRKAADRGTGPLRAAAARTNAGPSRTTREQAVGLAAETAIPLEENTTRPEGNPADSPEDPHAGSPREDAAPTDPGPVRMNRAPARRGRGGEAAPYQDRFDGWRSDRTPSSDSRSGSTRAERRENNPREVDRKDNPEEDEQGGEEAVVSKPLVGAPVLEGEKAFVPAAAATPTGDATALVDGVAARTTDQPKLAQPKVIRRDGLRNPALAANPAATNAGDASAGPTAEASKPATVTTGRTETPFGGDLKMIADPILAQVAKRVVVRRGEAGTTPAHAPGDAVLQGLQRAAAGAEAQVSENSPVNRLAGSIEMWLARPRGEELGPRQARFEINLGQGQTAQIQVVHDGDQLRVNLAAPNEQLRAWLQDNGGALQQRLQQRGGLNVEVRIGGQTFSGDSHDGRSRQQRDIFEELNDDGARFNKPLHMLYGKRGSR